MSEQADIQSPQEANPSNTPNGVDNSLPQAEMHTPDPLSGPTFIYPDSRRRIGNYEYFMRLLLGEHFEAFNIRIADEKYTREYTKLRYVMVNFAGLISKVVADMLFSEQPSFKAPNGDKNTQEFIDAIVRENHLNTQNYESAVNNSAKGDALYKIRIGERFANDGKPTVIIEDTTPNIFFPHVNGFNVRAEPECKELAWTFWKGKNKYLRKELHFAGRIENEVWSMEGEKILLKQSLSILDPNLKDVEETKIDRSLIIHIPNWKTGDRYFGLSDYLDLDKLFYAINNRFTKLDNILDKHGDPILSVPAGVLDEKGQVKKKALGVIELGEGETGKPEYIVWDAKLEAAFEEVDKLIEMLLMIAEISPDTLGMGKGVNDSGRALKLKILRTIAKVSRKKLYYDQGLKETIYTAMFVAKEHSIKIAGLSPVEPVMPDIEWADGLPMDMAEQVDIEAKRLDSGTTTKKDAIMRLDSVDEETAKKMAEEIKEETAIEMPESKLSTSFGPNSDGAEGRGKRTTSPDAVGKTGQK